MTGTQRRKAWKKEIPKQHPKWIWLSFLGLSRIGRGGFLPDEKGNPMFRAAFSVRPEDEDAELQMGCMARLVGLMLGAVIIPGVLMCCAMDRMPEPYATVWNCFILLYVYFAGVFITDYLYNYCHRWWYQKQDGQILYHKGDSK